MLFIRLPAIALRTKKNDAKPGIALGEESHDVETL